MKAHGSRGSEFALIQLPNKNGLDTLAGRERGEDDDSESDSCSEQRTRDIDWSFRLAKALAESGEHLRSCFTSLSKLQSPRSTSLERWSNDVLRAWALPIEARNPRSEHSRLFSTQTFLPSERGTLIDAFATYGWDPGRDPRRPLSAQPMVVTARPSVRAPTVTATGAPSTTPQSQARSVGVDQRQRRARQRLRPGLDGS